MMIFIPLEHTQLGKWFSVYDTVIDAYVALRGNQTWETFEDFKKDAESEEMKVWGCNTTRLFSKKDEILRWESQDREHPNP